jgi:hypothetical protein
VWRSKLQRWLPYIIDAHIIRQLNARYSKEWAPTPWPVEKPPAAEELPASVKTGLSQLKAFSQRIAALRKKPRH